MQDICHNKVSLALAFGRALQQIHRIEQRQKIFASPSRCMLRFFLGMHFEFVVLISSGSLLRNQHLHGYQTVQPSGFLKTARQYAGGRLRPKTP